MKKDTVYLVIAVAILLLSGLLLYAKFGPGSKTTKVVSVEVITPIDSSFNQNGLSQLTDPTKAVNYVPDINLNNLGNSQPFGPLH